MEFFFFNNVTQKITKHEQIHLNHEMLEKTRSINDIKFTSFQRKPVKTLKLVNTYLDGTTKLFAIHISPINHYNTSLTMKTTTNTGKNEKFSRKVPEESVESNLNHKLYSGNFISDPLNTFPKPIGTISIRIM